MKNKSISIIQIGVGGTGSFLIPLNIKLFNNLYNYYNINIKYILIDHDIVEPLNIKRQNFEEEQIGRNKALSMCLRYYHIFKYIYPLKRKIINSKYINDIIYKNIGPTIIDSDLFIIIGCVDNNQTRRYIFKSFDSIKDKQIIYIDSGNSLYDGQVITLSRNLNNKDFTDYKKSNIDFLKIFKLNDEKIVTPSCELFGDQSIQINNMAASLIYTNIQNLLVENKYPPDIIKFNSFGRSYFKI